MATGGFISLLPPGLVYKEKAAKVYKGVVLGHESAGKHERFTGGHDRIEIMTKLA